MPSQESLPPQNQWTERTPRETVPTRGERPEGGFDGIRFEGTSESQRENEGLSEEQVKERQLIEFLNAMPTEKLRSEQDRLQAFIDEVTGGMDDLAELSPESAAMTKELIREEIDLLEAIKTRRVHREDVLGKIPTNRMPGEMPIEYRPTEYPPGQGPKEAFNATIPPPFRKKRTQDIGTSRTELPKSDLPN